MTDAIRPVAIGTLLLLLLCLLSGRPQVFSDTKSYYSLGQELGLALVPHHRAASDTALRGRPLTPGQSARQTRLAYTVAASRSPYWSVLLYLLVQVGTAWLFVVAQAFVAAATIWLAARAWGVERGYLPVMVVLAACSSLPVFVLFLMPDLFAGLMILAAATLLFRHTALGRGERGALWLVCAAGACFHTSHMLLLVVLAVGALPWARRPRGAPLTQSAAALLLSAAAVAVVGAVAFPLGVRVIRHEQVYAPPFLAARLIADGPGRALLHDTCRTGREWTWCRYTEQPMTDVNRILWDAAPATATFQAADYAQRVRIIREQPRFVLAVVRHDPLAVAGSVIGNVSRLFFRFGTTEVLSDPTATYRDPAFSVFSRIVPGTEACRDGVASCASRLSAGMLDFLIGTTLLLSVAVISVLLLRHPALRACWLPPALFMLAALMGNALICGALSGNAERYQSRVTWLVPLVAAFLLADRRAARDRSGFVASMASA